MQQLQFLQTVLLVLLIIDCLGMVGVILLQRSEGGALGMGGGGGGLMTARGAGNLLTRTTAVMASLFFVLAVSLTIIGNYENSYTAVGKAAASLKRNPAAARATPGQNAATPTNSLGAAANNAAGSLGDLETGAPITLKQGGPTGAPAAPAAKSPPAAKK